MHEFVYEENAVQEEYDDDSFRNSTDKKVSRMLETCEMLINIRNYSVYILNCSLSYFTLVCTKKLVNNLHGQNKLADWSSRCSSSSLFLKHIT